MSDINKNLPKKIAEMVELASEIQGMVGRDEAPESISEQKMPTDMKTKKGLIIAVLRNKNKGMKAT